MKKNWKVILGVIFVVGGLGDMAEDVGGGFLMVLLGIGLIAWWYKKNFKGAPVAINEPEEEPIDIGDDTMLKYKVVGVRYTNEDGSTRQENLRAAKESGYYTVSFKKYRYNGEPAIHVLANGKCIGNIAEECVPEVNALIAKGRIAKLVIDSFNPTKNEKVYFADVIF